MGGVMSISVAVFGVFWTITALGIGAGPFALFGLVFIAVAVIQAVYHFKNATSQNRYSAFDITDGHEEPDPLNVRFEERSTPVCDEDPMHRFCPYCGTAVASDYEFCNQCGKKLP